jgi:glycosyltransferase involved in cell wall biosynthesis
LHNQPAALNKGQLRMRLHFIANSFIGNAPAGGDFHMVQMAKGAVEAGYELNFIGGHALETHIKENNIPATFLLTDDAASADYGKFRIFSDWWQRYRRTMARLNEIRPEDGAYAVSDYWCDTLPVCRSRSKHKAMPLLMEAPSIGQALFGRRLDVVGNRLSSLHYAASQHLSLRTMAKHGARVLSAEEYHGVEAKVADSVPAQERTYDVVWIGRISAQKGINDLLSTLEFLNQRVQNFRAVLVGNVKSLQPEIDRRGLRKCVSFSGRISEEEKFRIVKSSRVFLMTSHHEGLPIVASESIISNTPVVGYKLPHYAPLFGSLMIYVPPFELSKFQSEAERVILEMRSGKNPMPGAEVQNYKDAHSWRNIQNKFVQGWKKSVEASKTVA